MNGDRHARLSAATPTLAQIPIRPHTHTHTHSAILRCHQKDCRLPCLSLLLLQSFWLWTADKKKGYERNRTGKKIVPLQRIKIQKVKRKVKDFKIRPGPKWLSVCRNESREFVKKKRRTFQGWFVGKGRCQVNTQRQKCLQENSLQSAYTYIRLWCP